MDAGLPPHQYHIHPLPQHYQHYLTSPRMHHFPRNNASTQVVSPPLPLYNQSLPAILFWVWRLISIPSDCRVTCVPLSFLISAAELMLPLLSVIFQVVHEIRNYPYPQLHLLALQSLNPSRHASAVRESYEVRAASSSLSSADTPVNTHLSLFPL